MRIGYALLVFCCVILGGTGIDYRTDQSVAPETNINSGTAENTATVTSNDFNIDLEMESMLDALMLIREDDMNTEMIDSADVNSIKVESTGSAIIIEPSTDEDIKLMYSSRSDYNITTEISDGILNIHAKAGVIRDYKQSDYVLKIYIPENLVEQLEIVSNAAFVQIAGKDGMFQSCNINVSVGAFYLENICADTVVKTITGVIKLKNETVKSNIRLGTQIGVVDIALGELPDNVSISTSGTVKRNIFLRTRSAVSSNEQFVLEAKSRLGVINIH